MKRALLSLSALLLSAAAAHAQVIITYTHQNKNSRLTVTYGGGFGYGYGGGYGGYYGGYYGGGGYGSSFGPGFIWNNGHSTFAFGTNFLGQDWRGYPAGYGAYGTYGYGGGYGMPSYYQNYRVPSYIDVQRSAGAPREVERLNVEKTNDVGIARFRAGDYAGALAAFKQIVVNDFSSPVGKLWMAMALAGAGDFKNAEKALRSAAASNEQLSALDLKGSLKDAKELARFSAAAEKAGGVTAGYILERLGEKEKAKVALEAALKAAPKDGEAEKLKARVN